MGRLGLLHMGFKNTYTRTLIPTVTLIGLTLTLGEQSGSCC